MNKLKYFLLISVLSFFPIFGYAQTSQQDVKDRMITDLDIIKKTFEVKYAPAEWKNEYADWDLDDQMDRAKVKVLETPGITLKDYQRIVKAFINSTQDYHVNVSFYSTESAFLPFRVHSAKGRYYFAWVYDAYFSGFQVPIKKGDEILTFNGRPIDEVVQELKSSDFGNPSSATDQALVESALTTRTGTVGNIIPKGPITVTVRHTGTDKTQTYNLRWLYSPEEISSPVSLAMSEAEYYLGDTDACPYKSKDFIGKPLGEHPFFFKDMTAPLYSTYREALLRRDLVFAKEMTPETFNSDYDEEDLFVGSKKSFVPPLGSIVWEASSDNPFHAYIYTNAEGKRIGYIRIPHYVSGKIAVEKFVEIIKKFESQTQALVVDQLSNPGGDLFYMYALAAALTDTPLYVPAHRMTITQEDVYTALQFQYELENVHTDQDARNLLGATISGYPVDYDFARGILKHFCFVIREWDAGRTFTEAAHLYGLDYLKPHPKGHYSKPILLLINELDFSCGDFLPAILQDNKRATILGTRTAGAGGYVLSHGHPNLFGVKYYHFTGSLAKRIDQSPIENLGVSPDIEVTLTPHDLEGTYKNYVSEIHQAVSKILSK